MCAENVLRLAEIDCSSPMSANIDLKTGSCDPCSAGTCSPACAISGEQSGRLQRDGLAAGVRPGDDEDAVRRRQQDVDRDRVGSTRLGFVVHATVDFDRRCISSG